MKPTPLQSIAGWLQTTTGAEELISRVVIDSRQAGPETLFVALPGAKTDGHRFVSSVIEQGGSALVSEPGFAHERILQVDNTLTALQTLAGTYLRQNPRPIVAVTGSNGKTTTKDLTAAVLGAAFAVHATAGNYNNEIGLPLTILSMPETAAVLVLEMAMRGSGQIRELTQIAPPDIGVITNIGPVHLELLGSLEAVAAAKGELLQALVSRSSPGRAVLNADDENVRQQWQRHPCPVLWVSTKQPGLPVPGHRLLAAADIRGERQGKLSFTAVYENQRVPVALNIPGRHNVENALLALGVGIELGIPLAAAAPQLRTAAASPRRMEIYHTKQGCLVVNDAYNSSPASLRAAVDTIKDLEPGAVPVAVVGDMLELGDLSPAAHQEAGSELGAVFEDILYVGRFGGFFREGLLRIGFPMKHFQWVNKVEEAVLWVRERNVAGSILLLKASRGIGLDYLESLLERDDVGGRR